MEDLLKIVGKAHHNLITDIFKSVISILLVSSFTYFIMGATHAELKPAFFATSTEWLLFFLSGSFAIPLGVFLVVWFATDTIGKLVFGSIVMKMEGKAYDLIMKMAYDEVLPRNELELPESKGIINELRTQPKKDWPLAIYERVRGMADQKEFAQIKKRLEKVKIEYFNDFVLIFRSVIGCCVFVGAVDSFGWLLFAVIVLTLLIGTFFTFLFYLLAYALPLVAAIFKKKHQNFEWRRKVMNE